MPTVSDPDGGPNDVPDEVVEALEDGRRRAVVRTLRDNEGGVLTLVTLASRLAVDADASLRDLVVELHDAHVPVLEACGLVDYDGDTGEVSLEVPADTVTAALAKTRNADR